MPLKIPTDKVKEIIKKEYGLETKIIDTAGWGYNSTAYYIKTPGNKEYIAKTTQSQRNGIKNLKKDIYLSQLLHNTIPTSNYISTKEGSFLVNFNGFYLRVSEFLPGALPFDMNLKIYKQALEALYKIHSFPTEKIKIELEKIDSEKQALLHGDLTASNMLVISNKIIGIFDFEESILGPPEYDLARSCVFCWFRMEDTPFKKVAEFTRESYPATTAPKLFRKFSLIHAAKHLNKIVKNKDRYKNKEFWQDDYDFASNSLKEIEKYNSKF